MIDVLSHYNLVTQVFKKKIFLLGSIFLIHHNLVSNYVIPKEVQYLVQRKLKNHIKNI